MKESQAFEVLLSISVSSLMEDEVIDCLSTCKEISEFSLSPVYVLSKHDDGGHVRRKRIRFDITLSEQYVPKVLADLKIIGGDPEASFRITPVYSSGSPVYSPNFKENINVHRTSLNSQNIPYST